MLVLLPDDAGGQLGRAIVREPAVSCGCDHVRRPRGVDQPRHGGDATAVGGGAVTWAAPRPSTLHGRTTLRLLRLGDPPHLRPAGPVGDTPEGPRHRPPRAVLLRQASATTGASDRRTWGRAPP